MKTKDVYPSRYVTAEDLEKPINLSVENVVLEKVYDRQEKEEVDKPICYFKNAHKGLLLNKTNWGTLAKAYGDESDSWKGKPVILVVVSVQSFGDIVDAVRIKIPKANGYAPSPEAAAAMAELFPEPTMPATTTKEPKP